MDLDIFGIFLDCFIAQNLVIDLEELSCKLSILLFVVLIFLIVCLIFGYQLGHLIDDEVPVLPSEAKHDRN